MRTLLRGLLLVAGLLAAAPARAVAVCAAVADPTLPFGNVNSNAPGATTGTPPTPLVLMTANASETSRVAKACPPIHTRLPLALA